MTEPLTTPETGQLPAAAGRAGIRTPDQRLRVFVSSTLHELAEERRAARAAIARLRLSPVLFELGARPHPPRDLYRAYLAQSHIFVGIYWQRYGWIAPGETISGLEEEYRLAGDRPKLIYVKSPAPEREPRLKTLLDAIRDDDTASYKPFESPAELQELLENDLALLLTERFESRTALAGPALAGPAERPRLPRPSTTFIGREVTLARAQELLGRDAVRLVTLIGPGGIGKTRVALELATRVGPSYEDGVRFVGLSTVREPQLVLPAIARALGLREALPDGSAAEHLTAALGPRRLLLVLDGFEHVLDAATAVAELLAAPGLKLLVTSRAVLRLSGEHELPVPPMGVPPETESDPADLLRHNSVRLFVERARAVQRDFELTPLNSAAVAELCRRLDGLPLAIELAAARVRILQPPELLRRMDRRLALLTDGPRDLPERQQTLRATIDWSYELLSRSERVLFERLAVFPRGSELDAIEQICDLEGRGGLLEPLLALVDKSLVWRRDGAGGTRFGLLSTIREYALEKLEGSEQHDALLERLASHYLSGAEANVRRLHGPEQATSLERLEADIDNYRLALDTLLRTGRAEEALRCCAALRWFWVMRGYVAEGREWLRRALDLGGEVAPSVNAAALMAAAVLAWRQGSVRDARPPLERSLAFYRECGDQHGVGAALRLLGVLAHNEGAYAEARALLEESLALMRDLGDPEGVANATLGLGNVALDLGEDPTPWYQQSLEAARSTGDLLGSAYALDNLGVTAWYRGDEPTALALTEQVRPLYEQLGNRHGLANVRHRLGLLALARGEPAAALTELEAALELKRQLGEARSTAFLLYDVGRARLQLGSHAAAAETWRQGLEVTERAGAAVIELLYVEGGASLLAALGEAEEAVRWLAAVQARREELAVPVAPVNRPRHELERAELRRQLGDAGYETAWAEGHALSWGEALHRLRALLERESGHPGGAGAATPRPGRPDAAQRASGR